MVPISEVDVCVTRFSEHWHISSGHTVICVAGAIIASPVSLNFYDSTNQPRVVSDPDKVLAEEASSYADGASGIEVAW